MLALIFLSLNLQNAVSISDYIQLPTKPCQVGDILENECNKCMCSPRKIFECIQRECDPNNYLVDNTKRMCLPNQVYTKNLTCVCTSEGEWPHKSCEDTFMSLSVTKLVSPTCEPDTYITIDCNVCRCGPDGKLNRCTTNICDKGYRRTLDYKHPFRRSNVYSKCINKNWYAFSPCQFCYCVNENKLVCNTGDDKPSKLSVGTYKMHNCGTNLVNDALDLLPDEDKKMLRSVDLESKETKTDNDTDNQIDADKEKPDNNTSTSSECSEEGTSTELTIQDKETEKPKTADSNNNITEKVGESYEVALGNTPNDSNNNGQTVKGQRLNIHFPEVLDKVFQMTLRKSMVTIDPKTKCTPGETKIEDCNMCFCLKNGKLLCSSKKCE